MALLKKLKKGVKNYVGSMSGDLNSARCCDTFRVHFPPYCGGCRPCRPADAQ